MKSRNLFLLIKLSIFYPGLLQLYIQLHSLSKMMGFTLNQVTIIGFPPFRIISYT